MTPFLIIGPFLATATRQNRLTLLDLPRSEGVSECMHSLTSSEVRRAGVRTSELDGNENPTQLMTGNPDEPIVNFPIWAQMLIQ
jgi:hypothetical protein